MRDLYNKTNAPYLIAGALAALTLLASGTLAVAPYVAFLSPIAAFNVALPVALSLSILSTLILALSCKMIKKIEIEKNKFAEKEQELANVRQQLEQELENKITLEKEAGDKQVEELTREKKDLESKVKRLNDEKEQLAEDLRGKANEIKQLKSDDLSKQVLQGERDSKGTQTSNDARIITPKDQGIQVGQQQRDTSTQTEVKRDSKGTRANDEEKAALQQKVQELESKVAELNNAISDKDSEIGELESEIRDLNHRIQELHINNTEPSAKDQYQGLCDENEKLNERVSSLVEKLSQLKKEKGKFTNEIDELAENNQDLKSKIEGLNKEVNRLRGQQATTEQQLDQKTQGLAAKTQELGDECGEKEQLRMQLETKEKKIEKLEDKSEKTGKLLGEKVTEILELKSEIENLRVKIGEITKEKENLSGKLHNEEDYVNNLLCELDGIRKDCDSKVKKLQDLLLDESLKRELLEKDLLKEKKSVAQQIIEYVTNKVNEVEELTKKNEEMGDLERSTVLFATRFVKHEVLEEIDEQYLSRNDTTSSEHLSEFEEITKNEFDNGLLSPNHMSAPKIKISTKDRKKSPSKSPEKMGKENSGQSRSPHTSTGSPNLSPFKDRTNNSIAP